MRWVFSMALISFTVAMAISPLLIHILYKKKIVRKTDADFSHIVGERFQKAGTPIMGGLLIIIATTLVTVVFNLKGSTYIPIIIMLLSSALGGIDDLLNVFGRKHVLRTVKKQIKLAQVHKNPLRRLFYWVTLPWTVYKNIWYSLGSNPGTGLQAGERILVQIAAGCMVAWWIYYRLGWNSIWIPWIGDFQLGAFMPVFIVITVVSMTNAVNISDGMDGLASGMLIPAFTAFMFIAIVNDDPTFAALDATVVGALLAYLYFNIKPARIEMGDVGSMALGALLATVALAQKHIILLPVIGFTFVTIIGSSLIQGIYRRIFNRRLLKMAPLHLHFQLLGWSEEKIVMRFWLFAVIFAFIGVWMSFF